MKYRINAMFGSIWEMHVPPSIVAKDLEYHIIAAHAPLRQTKNTLLHSNLHRSNLFLSYYYYYFNVICCNRYIN